MHSLYQQWNSSEGPLQDQNGFLQQTSSYDSHLVEDLASALISVPRHHRGIRVTITIISSVDLLLWWTSCWSAQAKLFRFHDTFCGPATSSSIFFWTSLAWMKLSLLQSLITLALFPTVISPLFFFGLDDRTQAGRHLLVAVIFLHTVWPLDLSSSLIMRGKIKGDIHLPPFSMSILWLGRRPKSFLLPYCHDKDIPFT